MILALGIAGLAWGTVVGFWTWMILGLLGVGVRPGPMPEESVGPIVWRGLDEPGRPRSRAGGQPVVKPPQNQFTLGELMGLVALFALSFAMLTTSLAPLGVGVLIVVPGFVLERARGGKGIIGGIVSGCALPQVVAMAWAAFDLLLGGLQGQRDPQPPPGILPALRHLPGVVGRGELHPLCRGPEVPGASSIEPAGHGSDRRGDPVPVG